MRHGTIKSLGVNEETLSCDIFFPGGSALTGADWGNCFELFGVVEVRTIGSLFRTNQIYLWYIIV